MKLSVLLILSENEENNLRAVDSIAAQTGDISAQDIFLVIAGKSLDDNRKQQFLDRSKPMGLTAFIDFTADNDAGLFNSFITHANADLCTVIYSGTVLDREYFSGLLSGLGYFSSAKIAMGVKLFYSENGPVRDIFCPEGTKSGLIRLDEAFGAMPWFFEGTMINTEFAAAHLFDGEKGVEAEKYGLMKMLFDSRSFVFVSEVKLICAQKRDWQADYRYLADMQWYTPALEGFMLPLISECKLSIGGDSEGRLPMFMQYFLLRMILCRLYANRGQGLGVINKENIREFKEKLFQVLQALDDRVVCNAFGLDLGEYDVALRRHLLALKHDKKYYNLDISYTPERLFLNCRDMLLGDNTDLSVNIRRLCYSKGKIELEGDYPDVFSSKRVKFAAEYAGETVNIKYTGRYSGTEFFGSVAYKNRCFRLSLIVNEDKASELGFVIFFKGIKYPVKAVFEHDFSRISEDIKGSYLPLDGKLVCYAADGKLKTEPTGKLRRFGKRLQLIGSAGKAGRFGTRLAFEVSRPFFKNKNIWLFVDDGKNGGGAGEEMFKYAMTRTDELYCYYLIDKGSDCDLRLKEQGYKAIYSGRLISRLLYLNAKVVVSSKSGVSALNGFESGRFMYFKDLPHYICARIQSRMFEDIRHENDRRLRDNTDYYFCETQAAVNELAKPAYGYEESMLKLAGVMEYESLLPLKKKEEPVTDGEQDTASDEGESESKAKRIAIIVKQEEMLPEGGELKNAAYFKLFNGLINDGGLKKAAKEAGCTVQLYLDKAFAPIAEEFAKNEHFELVTAEADETDIIKNADLVISSDRNMLLKCAYIGKGAVYLQASGISLPDHRLSELKLCPQAHSKKDLARLLCEYLRGGIAKGEEYAKNAENLFGTQIEPACKVIYDTLLEAQKTKNKEN